MGCWAAGSAVERCPLGVCSPSLPGDAVAEEQSCLLAAVQSSDPPTFRAVVTALHLSLDKRVCSR